MTEQGNSNPLSRASKGKVSGSLSQATQGTLDYSGQLGSPERGSRPGHRHLYSDLDASLLRDLYLHGVQGCLDVTYRAEDQVTLILMPEQRNVALLGADYLLLEAALLRAPDLDVVRRIHGIHSPLYLARVDEILRIYFTPFTGV